MPSLDFLITALVVVLMPGNGVLLPKFINAQGGSVTAQMLSLSSAEERVR